MTLLPCIDRGLNTDLCFFSLLRSHVRTVLIKTEAKAQSQNLDITAHNQWYIADVKKVRLKMLQKFNSSMHQLLGGCYKRRIKLGSCQPFLWFSARIAEGFHQQRGVIKDERAARERRGTVDQCYRHIRRFHEIPIFFSTAAEHITDVREDGGGSKKKNTTDACLSVPLGNFRKNNNN